MKRTLTATVLLIAVAALAGCGRDCASCDGCPKADAGKQAESKAAHDQAHQRADAAAQKTDAATR